MKLGNNYKSMPLIGLFGGAFNPIHNGHLLIAHALINKLNLDELFFIPTGISATNKSLAPADHRLNMIKLALENKKMNACSYELDRSLIKKKSYTFNTLKHIFKKNNAINFFIIGSDNFLQINTWKNWRKLLDYSHIIIVDREISSLSTIEDNEIKEFYEQHSVENINKMKLKRNGYIYIHHMDYINIASSEIRKKLQSKKGVGDDAIPEKIRDYIAANNLYKSIGQVI